MKTVVFKSLLSIILGGFILTSCQSLGNKKDKAQLKLEEKAKKLKEAKQLQILAINDSIKLFRKEALVKIEANEKQIIDFKAKITTKKKESKAEYEKKLNALEQKNTALKLKLNTLKAEGIEKWTPYKFDFNNDLNELSDALKDFLYTKDV
jgi:hypothetical protein